MEKEQHKATMQVQMEAYLNNAKSTQETNLKMSLSGILNHGNF